MENKENKLSSVTKIKYSIQGKSARSQNKFKLDPEWIEEIFMIRETDYFKNIYQKHIPEQSDKYFIVSYVPI